MNPVLCTHIDISFYIYFIVFNQFDWNPLMLQVF